MVVRRFGIGIILIAALLGGCALLSNQPIDSSEYTLTYAMTTTVAAPPSLRYGPEGIVPPPVPVPGAASWSVDVAMIDDYDNPFVPQLTAVGSVVTGIETLTLTISWRREDTGLELEVLATQTFTDVAVAADLTIYGPLIR